MRFYWFPTFPRLCMLSLYRKDFFNTDLLSQKFHASNNFIDLICRQAKRWSTLDSVVVWMFSLPALLQMLQFTRKKGRSGSVLSTKSAISSGNRYHEGRMLTVPNLPSPDSSKTYLFEHVIGAYRFMIPG